MTFQDFVSAMYISPTGKLNPPPSEIPTHLLVDSQAIHPVCKAWDGYPIQVTLSLSPASEAFYRSPYSVSIIKKDLWKLFTGGSIYWYNDIGELVYNPD